MFRPPTNKEMLERGDKLHRHLDVCEQCEQHPFDLCPIGAKLLTAVVEPVEDPEPPKIF